MTSPMIHTNVPGRTPIALPAFYPEFAWYYPNCELETKYWFVRNVQPDWTIFDIGANIGYYSVLFSQLAPQGQIYAFEPTSTIELLKANLAHNGCANVEAINAALGRQTGRIEDGIYRIWGDTPEQGEYPFYRLDDFVAERGIERIDCLKIDVDSFDFDVLKGAEDTIRRLRPRIVVELNHALARRNQSNIEALDWLRQLGVDEVLSLDHDNFVIAFDTPPSRTFPVRGDLKVVFADAAAVPAPPEEEVEVVEARSVPMHLRPYQAEIAPITLPDEQWPSAVDVTGAGAQWTYVADMPWTIEGADDPTLRFAVDLQVQEGQLGVAAWGKDNAPLGPERSIPTGRRRTLLLRMNDSAQLSQIMFRNHGEGGGAVRFRLFGVSLCRLSQPEAGVGAALTVQELMRRVAQAEGRDADLAALPEGAIDVVPLPDLGVALGFSTPPGEREQPAAASLVNWRMERDDAPIFRYVYRNLRPSRHLEFGTWEGFGVVACAESCDAEIWTLNLPEGEKTEAGQPLYGVRGPDRIMATDSGEFIGRLYREAGYADRVHQVLSDSRSWRPDLPPGFFDSVLIDGGHTADVVEIDTDKAIALTHPGSIIMWHDFCPDEEALSAHAAPRGVVEAIARNHHRWRQDFSRIFWVQPSWVLIGVRR
jgi:FkbM family methyltransferase